MSGSLTSTVPFAGRFFHDQEEFEKHALKHCDGFFQHPRYREYRFKASQGFWDWLTDGKDVDRLHVDLRDYTMELQPREGLGALAFSVFKGKVHQGAGSVEEIQLECYRDNSRFCLEFFNKGGTKAESAIYVTSIVVKKESTNDCIDG